MSTTYTSEDQQLSEGQRTALEQVRETARRLGWTFYTPDEDQNTVVALRFNSKRVLTEVVIEALPSGRVNVTRKTTEPSEISSVGEALKYF